MHACSIGDFQETCCICLPLGKLGAFLMAPGCLKGWSGLLNAEPTNLPRDHFGISRNCPLDW